MELIFPTLVGTAVSEIRAKFYVNVMISYIVTLVFPRRLKCQFLHFVPLNFVCGMKFWLRKCPRCSRWRFMLQKIVISDTKTLKIRLMAWNASDDHQRYLISNTLIIGELANLVSISIRSVQTIVGPQKSSILFGAKTINFFEKGHRLKVYNYFRLSERVRTLKRRHTILIIKWQTKI